MKLRTKFSIMTCSLSLIVIAGVSVFLYIEEKKLLLNEMNEARAGAAESLAGVGREALITSSQIQLLNYISGIRRDSTVVYAAVTDPSGKIIGHSDITMLGKTAVEEDGKLTVSRAPIIIGDSEHGVALIAFSPDMISEIIDNTLEETRKRILGVAGAGILIGLLGAMIFSSMMIRPIRKMAEGAEKIGSGKLDTVIDVKEKDELGSLAGTLNRMAVQLEELDRMKQDFVSSITHEFRSPLNAMSIHFDLLAQEKLGALNEKQKDSMQVLKNNSKRLEKFINALLDVAKIERGKMEVIPENINLAYIVDDIVKLYSVHSDRKNITFDAMIDEGLPQVFADPDRTRQIITNLISNAIKFTPQGGNVTVRAIPEKERVRVSVCDTGMGIPEEQLDSIFNKFEQVKGIRQQITGQKGTGLGLAIVKGLVEQQGGGIWVESSPGGSSFHFTLPSANV